MIVEINPVKNFNETLIFEAPPSKSYTHRAIIISSLSNGVCEIYNWLICDDTMATIECCKNLGVDIYEGKFLKIHGTNGNLKIRNRKLNCRNSGSTLRFIMGLASLADDFVIITGYKSLLHRPIKYLEDALKSLGAYVISRNGFPPVKIRGKIHGGEVSIRGDVSSQFISSLLMIAPYLKGGLTINIEGDLVSKPYIDITLDVIENFGVKVYNERYKRFFIEESSYISRKYTIEGDYSSSSYLLILSPILNTRVIVRNLNPKSRQADRKILEILRDMGAKVYTKKDEIIIHPDKLEGIEVTLKDSPDLLPTVVALACKAKGETIIKGVHHARYKESDRIRICKEEFEKFGVKIHETNDGLKIYGSEITKGNVFDCHNDHRIAMSISVLALASEGKSIIRQAECVNKSFPQFYQYLMKYFKENIKIISP